MILPQFTFLHRIHW
ncbi:host cell factor-related [Schistosoma mansoni]|nr:host cell factor-related [Schistosoma mansoni]|eukprot:XP_018650198.1 host cell factor-related [Schistosoma mansoni]